MKLRCELHVNGETRKLLVVQGPNELADHLALKLAAYLLFWDKRPMLDASTKLPALSQFDFLPDVLALNEGGEICLWVECGSTTMNKLTKLTRRVPKGQGRIVVLKPSAREAQMLRADLQAQHDKHERIEILAWPAGSYKDWLAAVAEKTEIFGEAAEASINVVVNERPFAVDLERH